MGRIIIIFSILFTWFDPLNAQGPNPYAVIDSLRSGLEKIQDYQADMEIEVDVDFIKMPVKHATIYFKQPDKFKFKSDEFFMLPRRGFNNSFQKIIKEEYNALYTGEEIINGRRQYVIKIIPLSKKPDIILATWWIDEERYLVSRAESNTRNDGTFLIDFIYHDPAINLPAEMKITFEIEKMKLPLIFMGKKEGVEFEKNQTKGKREGVVYIRFSNYLINQNPDIDFEENDQ
ncbi:MAG: hypothetical protein JW731_08975 [Bacteroidales bacterium]|nr:hypothetical protein [Bacteroidales bacterium]